MFDDIEEKKAYLALYGALFRKKEIKTVVNSNNLKIITLCFNDAIKDLPLLIPIKGFRENTKKYFKVTQEKYATGNLPKYSISFGDLKRIFDIGNIDRFRNFLPDHCIIYFLDHDFAYEIEEKILLRLATFNLCKMNLLYTIDNNKGKKDVHTLEEASENYYPIELFAINSIINSCALFECVYGSIRKQLSQQKLTLPDVIKDLIKPFDNLRDSLMHFDKRKSDNNASPHIYKSYCEWRQTANNAYLCYLKACAIIWKTYMTSVIPLYLGCFQANELCKTMKNQVLREFEIYKSLDNTEINDYYIDSLPTIEDKFLVNEFKI